MCNHSPFWKLTTTRTCRLVRKDHLHIKEEETGSRMCGDLPKIIQVEMDPGLRAQTLSFPSILLHLSVFILPGLRTLFPSA